MSSTATRAATAQNPPGLAAFMAAIRAQESGGHYTDAGGGGYQILDWSGWAKAAGYGQYANQSASTVPPAIQDAVAKWQMLNYYYGPAKKNWYNVAKAWNGGPGCIGRPCANPVLGPGDTGVDNYAREVMSRMAGEPGGGAQNPNAGAGSASSSSATTAAAYVPGQTDCYFRWSGFSVGPVGTGSICFDDLIFLGAVVLGSVTMLAGTALVLAAIGIRPPAVSKAVSVMRSAAPPKPVEKKAASDDKSGSDSDNDE